MINIFYYIIIFIMGTVFGSFFSLAVYRIPLGLDITHEHSFCPKCKAKLKLIDLIPVFSYLFLRGKCRKCGGPIRIRYFLLEILSGIVFVTAFISFKLIFPFTDLNKIIDFCAFVVFYITVVLIIGIDKENRYVEKSVLLFGIIIQYMYIVYLYVSNYIDLYRYGMYLIIMLILFFIDKIVLKKFLKKMYFIQVIIFLDYLSMYIDLKIRWIILVIGLLLGVLYKIINLKMYYKQDDLILKENKRVPWVFCLGISSIVCVIVNNLIT